MSNYTPTKADKFTFGLWTVGNRGRDPFGEAVRPAIPPTKIVEKLAGLGAYGVNLHDNDLVPIDATPAQKARIVRDFKKALRDHDMTVPMATTNLFYDAVFRDGAFTSNDPKVRALALQKTMNAIDMGAELGARIYVFWGGREGAEVDASKDPRDGVKRFRECLNYLCAYAKSKKYGMKFALEAKPNEPRGDIYLSTTGAMMAFIETLDDPKMVGVNPEVGHEEMAGLNFYHVVGQALEAGKLYHIDLNNQKGIKFDQDLRFGSENIKGAFYLVKLLEDSGWSGPRHFDAHPYRTEDEAGVWDFAAGCMRTYLILKEKARLFNRDAGIQTILSQIRAQESESGLHALMGKFSPAKAQKLKQQKFNKREMAAKGLRYEKLDQLVIDLLLGAR